MPTPRQERLQYEQDRDDALRGIPLSQERYEEIAWEDHCAAVAHQTAHAALIQKAYDDRAARLANDPDNQGN